MTGPRQRRGLRRKVAANPATDLAWRILVGVIGGTVTFVGIVFLVTPGPGWLVIFVGLGILASEFAWAERALFQAKVAAMRAKERALSPAKRRWLYLAAVLVLALIGAGIWVWVR
jgi:uncharacterized protein (TIGR02611 family)